MTDAIPADLRASNDATAEWIRDRTRIVTESGTRALLFAQEKLCARHARWILTDATPRLRDTDVLRLDNISHVDGWRSHVANACRVFGPLAGARRLRECVLDPGTWPVDRLHGIAASLEELASPHVLAERVSRALHDSYERMVDAEFSALQGNSVYWAPGSVCCVVSSPKTDVDPDYGRNPDARYVADEIVRFAWTSATVLFSVPPVSL